MTANFGFALLKTGQPVEKILNTILQRKILRAKAMFLLQVVHVVREKSLFPLSAAWSKGNQWKH